MILTIDPAKSLGLCWNVENELYTRTIVGDPLYQYGIINGLLLSGTFDTIVVEALRAYNTPNAKTLVTQSARYGYLVYSLFGIGYDVTLVHPGTWRKHLHVKGRKGTEKKKFVQAGIKEYTSIHVPYDEADALGMWLNAKRIQFSDLSEYTLQRLPKLTQASKEIKID